MIENENHNEVEETSQASSAYEALADIGDNEFEPDPWYATFGRALGGTLAKALLFVGSFLVDILLALCKIVVFVFKAIVGLFIGIYKLGVKLVRIWRDVDWTGRVGFFVQGVSQLKAKQWLDGFVFLLAEVLFFLFLGVSGIWWIGDLVVLSDAETPIILPNGTSQYPTGNNQNILIFGFIAVFVCIAYVILFVMGFKANYDTHQIVNQPEYTAARNAAAYVIDHYNDYVDEEGRHLAELSRGKIRKLMHNRYGFDKRAAAYISYVDWKKYPEREANGWEKFVWSIQDWAFNVKEYFRRFSKGKTWMSPLERYLSGDEPVHVVECGHDHLAQKQKTANTVFHHKFDKYNNYHSYLRDERIYERVFKDGEKLFDALFAMDPVSQSNGLEPLPLDGPVKKRFAVSRVVGAFEIPLANAKRVTRVAVRVLNDARKNPGEDLKKACVAEYKVIGDLHTERINAFTKAKYDDKIKRLKSMRDAYGDYLKLRRFYDEGEAVFVGALVDSYGLSRGDAVDIYRDYKDVIAYTHDDEMASIECLDGKAKWLEPKIKQATELPYNGQPTPSLKRVKEFADEKFAVTVMSLPTIGVLVVCILPLICSIAVGFTDWDVDRPRRVFTWSTEAFGEIFNLFGATSGSASYSYTFIKLLGWTIIWAIFATFTNYFAGIILALLINRKTIKGKAIYRTMFVISIAVPQFITLLTMNLLLGTDGPINALTRDLFNVSVNYLGDTANSALIPKITCIVVNMWIGVPYTMLSVSGILMNIPEDLYESSRIDGAGPVRQLVSITMPYVLFVTGPSLITTFVGNINNFNVIFFLVGTRGPNMGAGGLVSTAADTDLLINWLYNLCTGTQRNYNIASVIGMAIFALCAFLSLVVYNRMGSVQNEEAFQ